MKHYFQKDNIKLYNITIYILITIFLNSCFSFSQISAMTVFKKHNLKDDLDLYYPYNYQGKSYSPTTHSKYLPPFKAPSHSSVNLIPPNSTKTQTNNLVWKKILSLLLVYLQYFALITIISFHKSFEEVATVKSRYGLEKSYFFKDITQKNSNSIHCQDDIDVFASGKPEIIKTANDDLFELTLDKNYARIDRIVEVYNSEKKKWEKINNDSYIDDDNYLLPNLSSKSFFGNVELLSIKVNNNQLKALTKSEKIKIKAVKFANEILLYEFDHDSESTKISRGKKYSHSITNEEMITFTSSRKEQMRVYFKGYECKELSIVSKVYNNEFRTCHIPAIYKENENLCENSNYINQSVDMVVNPQIEFGVCNIFFCFCFNGAPLYQPKCDRDGMIINWVEEKIITKEKFFQSKYSFGLFYMMMVRILFCLCLIGLFYFLPKPLFQITKFVFGFDKGEIARYKFVIAAMYGTLTTVLTCLFAIMSYKIKNFVMLFVSVGIILCIIMFVIKESINPNNNSNEYLYDEIYINE